jgi:hypothetical protein
MLALRGSAPMPCCSAHHCFRGLRITSKPLYEQTTMSSLERQPSTGELGKAAFASLFSDRPLVLPPFHGPGHSIAVRAASHATSGIGGRPTFPLASRGGAKVRQGRAAPIAADSHGSTLKRKEVIGTASDDDFDDAEDGSGAETLNAVHEVKRVRASEARAVSDAELRGELDWPGLPALSQGMPSLGFFGRDLLGSAFGSSASSSSALHEDLLEAGKELSVSVVVELQRDGTAPHETSPVTTNIPANVVEACNPDVSYQYLFRLVEKIRATFRLGAAGRITLFFLADRSRLLPLTS